MKYKVCVLMSTYNGEKYIKEQIDSILAQEDVDIKIVIRDDGSSDRTVEIIKQYDCIALTESHNIGCEASFWELLHNENEADYYAFADQDDVWHPRKIISAINAIKCTDFKLYVCNLLLVDCSLHPIKPLFTVLDLDTYKYKMNSFIMYNLHGCVQVWKKDLHRLLQEYRPETPQPHDVWVNSVANIFSSTYVDSECYIKYRLHGNNTSGFATSIFDRLKKGLRIYLFNRKIKTDILAYELLQGYGNYMDKNSPQYNLLNLVANYKRSLKKKISLMSSEYITSNNKSRKYLFWLGILLNRY